MGLLARKFKKSESKWISLRTRAKPLPANKAVDQEFGIRYSSSMAIYGTALLSICLLIGLAVGRLLGWAVGLDKNIGGVGIAMLLLILLCDRLQKSGRIEPPTERGIAFWSSIYIPIVVAMAASQNVMAAVSGGWIAIVAGTLSVIACFALVPIISRIGGTNPEDVEAENTPS